MYEGNTANSNLIARFTSVDLVAKSLKWDIKKGGLSFEYSILGGNLFSDQTPKLDLFWASGTSLEARIQPIVLNKSTLSTSEGSHSLRIQGNLLKNAPLGTTHIVAAIDYENSILEVKENNNSVSTKDVVLTPKAGVKGRISAYSTSVVEDLLRQSGEASITITDLQRSPEDQARAMFNNILNKGIDSQKKLYGAAGDSVIDVYKDSVTGMSRQAILVNRAAIETAMVNRINLVGPEKVSRHCADPSKLQVIDLAPSSFDSDSRRLFQGFVTQDSRISKFLGPSNGDPAFHIEIPQSQIP